jgi:hypothetical protein
MDTKYDWEKLYYSALLEPDWSQIEERIRAMVSAINGRLNEFSLNHGGTTEENKAIVSALDKLKVLRKDVATWQNETGVHTMRKVQTLNAGRL